MPVSALQLPGVWRGRQDGSAGLKTIPTGFDTFDHYLPGGGWPVDGLTEILIDRYGIGELSLLMPALAGLSRQAVARRRWIVWVSPPFVPYAPALSGYGIDLNNVLLVHPAEKRRDVLWATEQVIRSASAIAVLAWLGQAEMAVLRRLQLSAEKRECWTVLFRAGSAAKLPSPARLRLALSPAAVSSRRRPGTRIDVLKCRGRKPATLWVDTVAINPRFVGTSDADRN